MKKFNLLIIVLFLIQPLLFAQNSDSKNEKKSSFFGYVRTYYHSDLKKSNDFIVKQARFGFKGNFNSKVSYKIFADAARLGNLSVTQDASGNVTQVSAKFSEILLDAFVKVKLVKGLSVTAGQFKIPFSTSNLRSPMSGEFVNRPMITKVTPGLRDMGLMVNYSNGSFPFTVDASLVNGSGQNTYENDNTFNYVFRGTIAPVKNLGFSANYYGGRLSGSDVSVFDVGGNVNLGGFYIDAEYSNRNTSAASSDLKSNALFGYVKYSFPVSCELFEEISPAFRYEIYDPNSSADNDKNYKMTAGLSFRFDKEDYSAIKINFENISYEANGIDAINALYVLLQVSF